jgi:hypothetical protein
MPGSDEIHLQNGKSRDDKDAASYIIRADFGATTESPVYFCLDSSKEAEIKAQQLNLKKVQQAARLIFSYLQTQPEQTSKKSDIVAHLKDHDISEGTVERALSEMKEDNIIDNLKQGYWTIVPEIEDDISPAA